MRKLSLLLRHELTEVASDGFVPIQVLLKHLPNTSTDDVLAAVASDNKQRYELRGQDIRACQGHTLPQVETKLLGREITEWSADAPVLHNTFKKNLESIKAQGLAPMRRRHVHFAVSSVMLRKGCNVQLKFDLPRWLQDGHKAYMSTNGVVMVDQVIPFQYLQVAAAEERSDA